MVQLVSPFLSPTLFPVNAGWPLVRRDDYSIKNDGWVVYAILVPLILAICHSHHGHTLIICLSCFIKPLRSAAGIVAHMIRMAIALHHSSIELTQRCLLV